jgi:DNA processing protein
LLLSSLEAFHIIAEMHELGSWVGLYMVDGVGSATYRKLVSAFGTPDEVFTASERALTQVAGPDVALGIRGFDTSRGNRQVEKAQSLGVTILTYLDPEYPKELGHFSSSPPILFKKGKLSDVPRESFAIVGSRRSSAYGVQQARAFSRGLANAGLCIVSGGARGIDTAAHKAALDAGGRTVAVLGTGLDIHYPSENEGLFERIQECGVLLSEFPFGVMPLAENFPKRNRVISALSLGVLVVQAAKRSGALLTAKWALEQGKDVFAVPNPIGLKVAQGVNDLIKDGAKLVQSVEDVLEEFGFHDRPLPDLENLDLPEPERLVLDKLALSPVHVDDLAAQIAVGTQEVLGTLLSLELKGLVRQLPGKYFVRGL